MQEVLILVEPEEPEAGARVAEAFARVAGRRVRMRVRVGDEVREFEGRVARRSEWPAAEDPFLLLRPGTMDRTHVLASMALHFRFEDGCLLLARRRHYEAEPLDVQRFPAGPVELRLSPLPEE